MLHVCVSINYCTITSVDSILSGQCCQGFGAQRDVASCRKRESRGKAKQDIFRSVRGGGPSPPFCPWGTTHQRKRPLPPFIPPLLPWPCSALLSLGHVLPSNTPLFPRDSDSSRNRFHLARSQFLTATCFPTICKCAASVPLFCQDSFCGLEIEDLLAGMNVTFS